MTDLQYDEWSAVAERFGVDLEQVRRDHLISHVLGAIAEGVPTDDVVFFGGTALSRTYLTDARLSEDIDLIALAPRADVAARIELAVRRGLARSHGRPAWRPALSATSGSQPATLAVAGTASVQIQLVSGEGYLWPTEAHDIEQRYSDAPPARLRTLTAAGFAAAKLSAWMPQRTQGSCGPSLNQVMAMTGAPTAMPRATTRRASPARSSPRRSAGRPVRLFTRPRLPPPGHRSGGPGALRAGWRRLAGTTQSCIMRAGRGGRSRRSTCRLSRRRHATRRPPRIRRPPG